MLHMHQTQNINIKTLIGVFDAEDLSWPYEVNEKYPELLASTEEKVTQDPLITWELHGNDEKYEVSYVVCRDYRIYSKFSEDPKFRLIFNAGNVTVFQAVK